MVDKTNLAIVTAAVVTILAGIIMSPSGETPTGNTVLKIVEKNITEYGNVKFEKGIDDLFIIENTKFLKFPKDSITVDSYEYGNIKYSIDFTKCPWMGNYWECKIQADGVEQINSVKYRIGNKVLYFDPAYPSLGNFTYVVDGKKYVSEQFSKSSMYNVSIGTDELILKSSVPFVDPTIEDWEQSNLTVVFDYNDQTIFDGILQPSNNTGSLVDSGNTEFVTETPSGEGFAFNSSATGAYHTMTNNADFVGRSEVEIHFAINCGDVGTAGSIMRDNTNADKFQFQDSRMGMVLDLTTTNCNIGWFEHGNSLLSANEWHYISGYYNSTTCAVFDNFTLFREEPSSGTVQKFNWQILRDTLSCTVDCVKMWRGGLLSSDARQAAYNDCFGISAAASDTCTPPVSGDWNIACSDNCNFATNDNIPANVNMNGAGVLNLNAIWDFEGSNQYININSGCQFNIHSGGEIS